MVVHVDDSKSNWGSFHQIQLAKQNKKFEKVCEIILSRLENRHDSRIFVFVEKRDEAQIYAKLLSELPNINALPFLGRVTQFGNRSVF